MLREAAAPLRRLAPHNPAPELAARVDHARDSPGLARFGEKAAALRCMSWRLARLHQWSFSAFTAARRQGDLVFRRPSDSTRLCV
jgi:hypothetical protein